MVHVGSFELADAWPEFGAIWRYFTQHILMFDVEDACWVVEKW